MRIRAIVHIPSYTMEAIGFRSLATYNSLDEWNNVDDSKIDCDVVATAEEDTTTIWRFVGWK